MMRLQSVRTAHDSALSSLARGLAFAVSTVIARASVAIAALALVTIPLRAEASIIDNINGSAATPFVLYSSSFFSVIGWYYTPSISYHLDGISTNFEPVPNGTGTRTVTVQIQTERPINGGTVLAQGTFSANSGSGGVLGASFSPVTLVAGHTYFVDYLNIGGMGINTGQWALDSHGNPQPSSGATVNLTAWYVGNPGDTQFSTAELNQTTINNGYDSASSSQGTQNFNLAEPILNFDGTLIVPEPSTLTMAACGLLVLVGAAWRRR
jgi:hypothetical protein